MDNYHYHIENVGKNPQQVSLFGMDKNMLAPNFGNGNDIKIRTDNEKATYIETIMQSGLQPFKTELLRFITDSWDDMPKEMIYIFQDITAPIKTPQGKPIDLVGNGWGKKIISGKAVNDVLISKLINGQGGLNFMVNPKTKIELLILIKR